MRKILNFFDKLEDHIRAVLSRAPIVYALVGALGIILMWTGVEQTAKMFPFINGPELFLFGVLILLGSGLLVSFFIGDSIIMSGLKGEKKLTEKTEKEILRAEHEQTEKILTKLDHIEQELGDIKRR